MHTRRNMLTQNNLPKLETYGRGSKAQRLILSADNGETLALYFSYQTLVAFSRNGRPPIVRENEWGTTTSAHLNAIDGGDKTAKGLRLDADTFACDLGESLQSFGRAA